MQETGRQAWQGQGDGAVSDGDRAWLDAWATSGYGASDGEVEKAVGILGIDGGARLAAGLRHGHPEVASRLCDALTEEADAFAKEWSDAHDGATYQTYEDRIEAAITHVMERGREGVGFVPLDTLPRPHVTSAHMVAGYVAVDAGDWEVAREAYGRAVVFSPSCASALVELAKCHQQLGDYEEAIRVAKLSSRSAWRLVEVARARRVVGVCEGALGHLSLAGANLVIAQDYAPKVKWQREMERLLEEGWRTDMTLKEALYVAPEEVPNVAFSADALAGMDIADDFFGRHPECGAQSLLARQLRQQRTLGQRQRRQGIPRGMYGMAVCGAN